MKERKKIPSLLKGERKTLAKVRAGILWNIKEFSLPSPVLYLPFRIRSSCRHLCRMQGVQLRLGWAHAAGRGGPLRK